METRDLNQGRVTGVLLRFTVPFLLANLLQTLYSVVDMLVVGRFADAGQMAAVSAGSAVVTMFNSFIIGLTVGATVLVGQYVGAGREDQVKKTVATTFTLLPLVAIAISAVSLCLLDPILRLMQTTPEAMEGTRAYVGVCLAGMVFVMGYNGLSSVLRGMGDSHHPLIFVAVSCAINVVGDLLLVGVFKMGALGAAIATIAAQALSMVFGIVYLVRKKFLFDFRLRSFGIDWEKARLLFRMGLPLALQDALVMVSFVILAGIINGLGYVSAAASGVADRFFSVAVIPSSAFSASLAAVVAQNIGGGREDRAIASLRVGLIFSFAIGAIAWLLAEFCPMGIARLFTSDETVAAEVVNYLRSYKYEYPLCALVFPINGLINGAGHGRFSMLNNIISTFVVRLPLVFLLSRMNGATLFTLGVGLPFASAEQLVGAAVFVLRGKWKGGTVVAEEQQ